MPAAAAAAMAAAAVSSGGAAAAGTTRWCPTAEQLMVLEEMYRGGLRTPNASQIQQITAHLAHYGRIEGKNVFYWFQNHKARDRQKLRRRLCMTHHLLSCAAAAAQAQAQHHYYSHHQQLLAGAVAPHMAQQQQQYYSAPAMACPAGGFDQHHNHQLLPASPMAPAGYAACYPAAGFATVPQPGSRCAGGGVSPAPAPASNTFLQYQQGGGGSPEYSLGRLGSFRVVVDLEEADTCRSTGYDYHNQQQQQMQLATARMEETTASAGFCRAPLKTLELFPGASVKDEQLA